MPLTRRAFLTSSVALLAGCSPRSPSPGTGRDSPRGRAASFLVSRQSADGTWRSDVYGTFKDGTALTPLAVCALQSSGVDGDDVRDAVRKGLQYLAGLVQQDHTIQEPSYGLDFPLYTAALSVVALQRAGESADRLLPREVWLKYLCERQLTEALGWEPGDREYGGWGYSRGVPRKPAPGAIAPPLIESNLSATVFALEALRAAKVPAHDPGYAKALRFAKRCQNWEDDVGKRDAEFDDGGFHFIYADPVRNKAGVAGRDRRGRERFFSYGSTTADGLRALLLCGEPKDAPRVRAAFRWLEKHFRADTHPGKYVAAHAPNRDAVYYYYATSAAKTFRELGVSELLTERGRVEWARALSEALAEKQQNDGSWVNRVELVRENDPIVATCFALTALGVTARR